VARALVDSGAVVALVNRADAFHERAVSWFRGFRGTPLTTEAVITEAAYVLAASPAHQRAALAWVQRAHEARILEVVPVEDHAGGAVSLA
jgi:predicted nucleic acid-binding protein